LAIILSPAETLALRLRAQRLHPRPPPGTSVAQIVAAVCGLQSQEPKAAALSVWVRSSGLLAGEIERARVEQRSVVRTWAMRGTLHLVASDDLGWLLTLLAPRFIAGGSQRRAELGLDEDTSARGIGILRSVLAAQGPLTRAEIVAQLATKDIRLVGQAAPHLIGLAALQGIICCGPDRGAKPTYVLLEDWLPRSKPLPRVAGLAELARRYLQAFAPAAPEDLAAWSGLPISEARIAWQQIADELIACEMLGRPLWMHQTQAGWVDELPLRHLVVRLLPAFDTYLLGYCNRDLVVEPQYARRINAGGGILHPTVLVGGRARATWHSKLQRQQWEVIVKPFADLDREVQPQLQTEVTDLGRFLGGQVNLRMGPSDA
jgi:Winged helix DNA-binding domain